MSPLSQKVWTFYTDTSKKVLDIHEEACCIADHENEKKLSAASKQQTQAVPESQGASIN